MYFTVSNVYLMKKKTNACHLFQHLLKTKVSVGDVFLGSGLGIRKRIVVVRECTSALLEQYIELEARAHTLPAVDLNLNGRLPLQLKRSRII